MWIGFSKRPLRLSEVAEAAVFMGDAEFDHEDRFQNPTDILEILGSLITCTVEDKSNGCVEDIGKIYSKEWSRDFIGSLSSDECGLVSLAHYSVMEYLISDRVINRDFGISEDEAHKIIVEGCLDYISQYDKSSAKTTSEEDLRCFPLLYYACELWHIHLEAVSKESQIPIQPLLHRLFLSPTELSSLVRVRRPDRSWFPHFFKDNEGSSPLYYSASIGLLDVVQFLLDEGADVNTTNENGATALTVAARYGHEPVVQLLLEHKADINWGDELGRTALHAAVGSESVAITRLLLQHNADPDVFDAYGNTALHSAAVWGHESIVQTLLKYRANVNQLNHFRQTALHSAVYQGKKATVQLLIENRADIHGLDVNGNTPLFDAVRTGQVSMVRLFLEHDADIDAKDKHGRTPLYRATKWHYTAVRNLLLEQGADVTQDYEGGIQEDVWGEQWTSDAGSEAGNMNVEVGDENDRFGEEDEYNDGDDDGRRREARAGRDLPIGELILNSPNIEH